jgi:hypothetical protein
MLFSTVHTHINGLSWFHLLLFTGTFLSSESTLVFLIKHSDFQTKQ